MEVIKTFRHEYKYLIPYEDMLELRKKLDKVLDIDRSTTGYMVRSLYFDSIDDNDYYDKLNGEMNRKKIRLRIYENDSSLIKLEIKAKYDIHQQKSTIIISRKDAEQLINGDYDVLLNYNNSVANEIYTIFKTGIYKPKVIIEYSRIAYKTNTTTRITFDHGIKKSDDFDNFFNSNINYYDILSKKDVVLEIKFDRYLEPYISNILSKYTTLNTQVSKYACKTKNK